MIRVCGVRFLTANAHIWWLRSKLMNGQKKKKNETTEACCSEIGIWMNEAVMNDHSIGKKEKETARKKSFEYIESTPSVWKMDVLES